MPLFAHSQIDSISVFFEKDQFVLVNSQLQKIIIDSMVESIVIKGYTDETGSVDHNQLLSANRAKTVEKIIIQKGKEKLLLSARGYGLIKSVARESKDNPKNRRVDILITKIPHEEKPLFETKSTIIEDSSSHSLKQGLEEIEVGEKLVLQNLSFVPGQHLLLRGAQATLDSLTTILKNNPKLKIAIEGHICCERQFIDGFDQMTGKRNLSVARAEYIYNELIKNGIPQERLTYEGFGRRQPIFPNEINERQKQANRRVEIRILER